ncbi:uncharacterized protein EKO05_0008078 [Ascochyta rabiei]|uniref:uncharacterized protein n=1 Tax=Didymella rabiei TaxID=5454 RepID=UPI00220C8A2F|nr:uncharacterized protein EKO05_0008078 [Ascochyta rabiei]UPX17738.1 hypothetical protein EKO05_0008078 [Ascochyta rabiei]
MPRRMDPVQAIPAKNLIVISSQPVNPSPAPRQPPQQQPHFATPLLWQQPYFTTPPPSYGHPSHQPLPPMAYNPLYLPQQPHNNAQIAPLGSYFQHPSRQLADQTQYWAPPPPPPPPATSITINNTINNVVNYDDSFRFAVPAQSYGWVGQSNLYNGQ